MIFTGTILAASHVAENRNVELGFFFNNSRQDKLLLAADCEPANIALGGGARFFTYEAIRVWDVDRLNNTLKDPRQVHNEYIEAFVNYGYIGFILFLLLVIVLCSSSIRVFAEKLYVKSISPINIALMGTLAAVLIQCLVDFTLHLMPLIMIFGVITGFLVRKARFQWHSWATGAGAVLALGLTIFICFPYWLTIVSYEQARTLETSQPAVAAQKYEAIASKTGEFNLMHKAGDLYIHSGANSSVAFSENALHCYTTAADMNPFNGLIANACGRTAATMQQYDLADFSAPQIQKETMALAGL